MREKVQDKTKKALGRRRTPLVSHANIHERIAEKAYELYERSGYVRGQDWKNWIEAEKIIKIQDSKGITKRKEAVSL